MEYLKLDLPAKCQAGPVLNYKPFLFVVCFARYFRLGSRAIFVYSITQL
jgi:hypothetical protein